MAEPPRKAAVEVQRPPGGVKVVRLPLTHEVEACYEQWLPLLHSMMTNDEDRTHLTNKLLPRLARMTIQHSRIFFITKNDSFYVYFSRRAFVYPRVPLDVTGRTRRGGRIGLRRHLKMTDLAACNELRRITELCGKSIVKVGGTDEKIFALSADGRMFTWGLDFSIEQLFEPGTNICYEVVYDQLFPRPLELIDQEDVPVIDFAIQRNRLVLLHLGRAVATVLDVETFAEVCVSLTELTKEFGFCPYVLLVQRRSSLIESDVLKMIMSVASELKEAQVAEDDPDEDFEYYNPSIVQLDVMRVVRLDWRCRLIIEVFIFMLTSTGQVYMVPTKGTQRPFRRLAFERLLATDQDDDEVQPEGERDEDYEGNDDDDEDDDDDGPSVFITGFIIDRMQRRLLAISDSNQLFEYWQKEDFMVLVESIDTETNKMLTPGEWMLMAAGMTSSTGRIYLDQMLTPERRPADAKKECHLCRLEPFVDRLVRMDTVATLDALLRPMVKDLLALLEERVHVQQHVRLVIGGKKVATLLEMFGLDKETVNEIGRNEDILEIIRDCLQHITTEHLVLLWKMFTTNQLTLSLVDRTGAEMLWSRPSCVC